MFSRLTIGILAQQSNRIGLFELCRIHDDTQTITWIKPRHSPFAMFVRPNAVLYQDPDLLTIVPESIVLLTNDFLRLTREGHVHPNTLSSASLIRLPYLVSFWEQFDFAPVYTLYPDHQLPWERAIVSAIRPPGVFYRVPSRATPSSESEIDADTATAVAEPAPMRRTLSADAICPITWEPINMENAAWTPCGHAFLPNALRQALSLDPRCPVCRASCFWANCVRPTT